LVLEILPKIKDIIYMYISDFVKGMSSIGQLHPAPCPYPYSDNPTRSAWEGVANSFRQAGDDLRFAIKKCSNEPESKQTP